eukprot:gb/GECH01008881.1/.p1 GENE.gb/GECH01008881.1/~~gb/GECH01008881.1/.p1  ORF type:complete len:170 (+),score=31.40 gb/GECH01008881.1/:1-510(+)
MSITTVSFPSTKSKILSPPYTISFSVSMFTFPPMEQSPMLVVYSIIFNLVFQFNSPHLRISRSDFIALVSQDQRLRFLIKSLGLFPDDDQNIIAVNSSCASWRSVTSYTDQVAPGSSSWMTVLCLMTGIHITDNTWRRLSSSSSSSCSCSWLLYFVILLLFMIFSFLSF